MKQFFQAILFGTVFLGIMYGAFLLSPYVGGR